VSLQPTETRGMITRISGVGMKVRIRLGKPEKE
jgi:hypothetical protein